MTALGIVWLLSTLGALNTGDWLWSGGLAAILILFFTTEARQRLAIPAVVAVMAGAVWLGPASDGFGVNWIWPACYVVAAIVIVTMVGTPKVSVVLCSSLLVAAVGNVLRQAGRIDNDVEIALCVTALGCSWFLTEISTLVAQARRTPGTDSHGA